MTTRQETDAPEGFVVLPLAVRIVAGLVDLVPLALLWSISARLALKSGWLDLPPRRWNLLDYLVDLVNERPNLALWAVVMALASWVVYDGFSTALLGNTPFSRYVAGALVVDCRDGSPVRLWRALSRSILGVTTLAVGLVGLGWGMAARDRRMLHDVLSLSVVCRARRARKEGDLRSATRRPGARNAGPLAGSGPTHW